MNNMFIDFIRNRKIIMFLLSFPIMLLYANESDMKITLESFTNGEKNITVIYQGSPNSELVRLIKSAKIIESNDIEKAVVFEGVYKVEFFDGKIEKKYSIQNNYWIYDEQEKRFLRCSICTSIVIS